MTSTRLAFAAAVRTHLVQFIFEYNLKNDSRGQASLRDQQAEALGVYLASTGWEPSIENIAAIGEASQAVYQAAVKVFAYVEDGVGNYVPATDDRLADLIESL